MPVGPRQGAGASDLEPILDFGLRVFDRVRRDVEAVDLDSRHHAGELIELEAFAAAHVEDSVACLQPVVLDDGARYRLPTARHVSIAAVVDAPVPVPIVIAPLLGEGCGLVLWKFGVVDARKVVALGALMYDRHEVTVGHRRLSVSLPAGRQPSRAGAAAPPPRPASGWRSGGARRRRERTRSA